MGEAKRKTDDVFEDWINEVSLNFLIQSIHFQLTENIQDRIGAFITGIL